MTLYADLFRYPDLFMNLFRRELRVKYKGSLLGLAWTLVNPIVLMVVYTLIFSVLLKAVAVPHFPLFVISGLLTWIFFQSTVQAAPSTLLGHADLVKQVRFPRQLLPLSLVATNLITLFAMLAILLPVNLAIIPATRTTFWAALPLIIPLVGIVSGIAIMVACANVLFRDVEHLITTILLPWFVATPIFYRFETLAGLRHHVWLVDALHYGNFVAPILVAIRDPLFFGKMPRLPDVIYSCVAAVVALALGALVFHKVDDQLAAEL
jgi:ABC-type polysaccharide/polyol phosphate export permease